SGTSQQLRAVARCNGGTVCVNGNVLVAAGSAGTVVRSVDHGATWSSVTNLPSNMSGNPNVLFNAVANLPGTDTMYLGSTQVVGAYSLIVSSDGGATWTTLPVT